MTYPTKLTHGPGWQKILDPPKRAEPSHQWKEASHKSHPNDGDPVLVNAFEAGKALDEFAKLDLVELCNSIRKRFGWL